MSETETETETETEVQEKPIISISNSSRQVLRSCARKFFWQKMLPHPSRSPNLDAAMGQALHLGFQHYLMHQDPTSSFWTFMKNYPVELCSSPNDPKSMEAGLYTLEAMHASAGFENSVLATVDGKPAIEVPFEIILEGIPEFTLRYIGFIDYIMYNFALRRYTAYDVKTTRRVDKNLDPFYRFSPQGTGYGLVVRHIDPSNVAEFDVVYLGVNISVTSPSVTPYAYTKTQEDVEDWVKGLLIDAQYIRHMYITKTWPRTGGGTACWSFGNLCYFFDICHLDTQAPGLKEYFLGGEMEAAPDEAFRRKTGWNNQSVEPWISFHLQVEGVGAQ